MDLKALDPTAVFETLRRLTAGEPVPEEDEVPACVQFFAAGQEPLAQALRSPALELLRALAAMIVACARPAWGEPTCYVRNADDDVPAWFEPYEYASGIPHAVHYLAGWERGAKQPLLWIGEEDYGKAPGLCLYLVLLVLE
jgi:hypothetical protein